MDNPNMPKKNYIWANWNNLERFVRLLIAASVSVNEMLIRTEAQPAVLLFVLAALGVPEALRLMKGDGRK